MVSFGADRNEHFNSPVNLLSKGQIRDNEKGELKRARLLEWQKNGLIYYFNKIAQELQH